MAKVSLRAYNREIEAMIDRSHLDEAIAHCHHILKIFPKHLETYRLLGKAYLETRRHDEAVDIFSRVLVSEPSDFVAQVGMSIIRDEQDKLDDAIWHMERAFEAQPSNAAIQSELQRLYGRRDGSQPSRIRMTRGALAHMYMQGELYPQAISETKSVLQEDAERSDMQVLLAKAYYRSGHKNDAADAASTVLKRYPYCIDANRVLAEILDSDRPDNAQVYRRRVIELDPYAAQVDGSLFQSDEVNDAAVSIDHLEWNGQPSGMPSGWGSTGAISLESGSRDSQPDWLKNALPAETGTPALSTPAFTSDLNTSSMPEPFSSPAQPAEDIPDFLRAAGWGESTGTFDESKASSTMFDDEPVSGAQPIAQGDMPDWVKAMAPPQESTEPAQESEEIPDWINKIGTGTLPISSGNDFSDLGGSDVLGVTGDLGSSQVSALDDQPDWLSGLGQEEESTSLPASDASDQPDWMKGFGQAEQPASDDSGQPDWLGQLGSETEETETTPSSDTSGDFDFLDLLGGEPEIQNTQQGGTSVMSDTGELGKSDQERDDSFAWLENLAAKQGATEGLLTKPEDRLENEPEWVAQAKNVGAPQQTPVQETPAQKPAANVEDLGKSGQEIDDALAWFEGLAAKQGATEGLLTKPEERMDKEPDWVAQVKSSGVPQQPAVQKPVEEEIPVPVSVQAEQPAANVEELGKSDEERDDSFAWLENLAAKQGATEGLLTKPEDRLENEPEWVAQAKSSSAVQQTSASVEAMPEEEAPAAADDVTSWLRGLDDEEEPQEVAPVAEDDTASWLRSLDEPEDSPVAASSETDDMPAWMMGGVKEEEAPAAESAVPAEEAESSDWMSAVEEPVVDESLESDSLSEPEGVPGWLSGLEEEKKAQQASTVSEADDLPAWMRDDTGEVVAEPTKIEPTRSTDWAPADEKKAEAVQPSPSAPKPAPAAKPQPKPEPKPAPAPKAKKPAPAKKEEVKPATPPEPYREPVTRRGTGMLSMPVDPVLGSARAELSRSNIPGALETYEKLIKKGRFLEETIYDLREALYRYPVEVSIWQTLGDAYMRANQLQDALDSYTKAEELLR